MRVLIINTSERIGGAAIAASRLMESLKNNGIKAKMLVRDKQTDQISVVRLKSNWLQVWKFMWERIVIWSANRFRRYHLFDVDIANTGTDITSLPEFRQADVIHLHWINQGMLSLNDIRKILTSGKPVVWTMHDMWYMHRHLPLRTGVQQLSAGMSRLSVHLQRRGTKGFILSHVPQKTEVIQLRSHSFRHVQPLAEGTSPDQCII
ncbi:glycosyltransferase [Bacteroides ovatus]|nr:glycosyltransferase [Bacteroides ovatus]MCS3101518.1 glycosyltransferase [Bacteroides ovatus]